MTHTKVFKQEYKLRGCDNRESKIAWKQYTILRRHRKQKVQAAKRRQALQSKLRVIYDI